METKYKIIITREPLHDNRCVVKVFDGGEEIILTWEVCSKDYSKVIVEVASFPDQLFEVIRRGLISNCMRIYFNKEKNNFFIKNGGFPRRNMEILFDGIDDATKKTYIAKLESLVSLQKMVDISCGDNQLSIDNQLDVLTKEKYLKELRSLLYGFNVKKMGKYFKNLATDVRKSWILTIDYFSRVVCFEGGIGEMIVTVLMPFTFGLPFPAFLLYYQIKNRLRRLGDYMVNKKVTIKRIKNLKICANVNIKEQLQQEINDSLENDKNDMIFLNQIPLMLNKLLELLENIPEEKYVQLSQKYKDILQKYKTLSSNNNLSDNDICYMDKELLDDIVKLELEIMSIKKEKRENNRANEISYLENRIEDIEEKGYAYQKLKKR